MMILVLNHAEVERLLPMDVCIEVMTQTFIGLAQGRFHQPLRKIIRPPDAKGLLGLMPVYRSGEGGDGAFGLKAVGVFAGNSALGKDSHQGAVMLFSGRTGELLAAMNASAITAIRTAAASAVATRALALESAGDLALVGSGIQARTHLSAMSAVRSLRRVRVCGRELAHAQAFARDARARYPFPIDAVEGAEAAVRGADLIVTVTNSSVPVLRREWIAPGAHLNVVGSSSPKAREVDSATVASSRLFVDLRESAVNEAGDYLLALEDGAIKADHIRGELGELLCGSVAGRMTPEDITLFKSLGLAAEDLAAAECLFVRAKAEGIGTWLEL